MSSFSIPSWHYNTVQQSSQAKNHSWVYNYEKLDEAVNHLDENESGGDPNTYLELLKWCSHDQDLLQGTRIYSHILKTGHDYDRLLMNTVVQMFGKCGEVDQARSVFDSIQEKNVFSWTMMIAAYAHNGHVEESLSLLPKMNHQGVKPDAFTFTTILTACAALEPPLPLAESIHGAITSSGFDTDTVVASAVINLYGRCGAVDAALSIFVRIHHRDVVCWSSMLGAFSLNDHSTAAVKLFRQMNLEGVAPNNVTFINLLEAITRLGDFSHGKQIHARILHSGYGDDVPLASALVKMFSTWGWLQTAKSVFRSTSRRDVISWSSIIAACSQNSSPASALSLFQAMDLEGVKPNSVTFVSVIDACGGSGALRRGVKLHQRAAVCGFASDVAVATALVNMYGKCGRVAEAEAVFGGMPKKNLLSWTSIAMAYAQNGHGIRSLKLLHLVEQEGMKPDSITFVSILVSCCYAGLLAKGLHYFKLMTQDFCIAPTVEHCGCMVEILGRSGKLEEAEQLINSMNFQSCLAWIILLTACKAHNDADRGGRAAENIFRLEPKNATPYVLLSSIYSASGRWDSVAETRKRMEDRGVRKLAGSSAIEVRDRVYEFPGNASDGLLPQELVTEIQAAVEKLMKEAGYDPESSSVMLQDGEEEESGSEAAYHSEKLALGFGILFTPGEEELRITKNLRMCSDCHTTMKLVSKLRGRKISVRDARRFHHFRNGSCSCGDYW